MGLQVLAGACSSAGCPWVQSFLQASICSGVWSLPFATGGDLLHHGPPWTARGQPASPWSSARAAMEDSLLQHLEHLLPPPSSLTLVSAELFLSHHLTPLSSLPFHCSSFFFLLLKYIIPKALPLSLIGLALSRGRSILEPDGSGFIRHGGSFSQLLTEATPIAPLLPKLCHTNPQHLCNSYFISQYKYLMEGCKEDGASLFSVVPSERTRHKLKYRKFQLNVRKTSFTVRVIEHEQVGQKGCQVSILGNTQGYVLSKPL